jgi:hypothetical protein
LSRPDLFRTCTAGSDIEGEIVFVVTKVYLLPITCTHNAAHCHCIDILTERTTRTRSLTKSRRGLRWFQLVRRQIPRKRLFVRRKSPWTGRDSPKDNEIRERNAYSGIPNRLLYIHSLLSFNRCPKTLLDLSFEYPFLICVQQPCGWVISPHCLVHSL